MSTSNIRKKTLSDKLTEDFAPRPLQDPEIDSEDETAARLADLDEDFDFDGGETSKLSEFRKRNTKLLSEHSEKYRGKVSSRMELQGEDSFSDDSDSDGALEEYRKKLKNCQINDEEDESLGTDEENSAAEDDDNERAGSGDAVEEDSDYDSSLEEGDEEEQSDHEITRNTLLQEANKNTEVQKGLAVQNQLKLWEKLLEVRIHSQKLLLKANSFPLPEQHQAIAKESEDFSKLSQETSENVTNLLDKMIEMQSILTEQYSETKDLLKQSKKRSCSQPSESEPPLKKFAETLEENFQSFRPYRNSVLLKWHDRTKILTPGAGSKKKLLSDDYDVVKKIEGVLMNKEELIKKSQIVKGNYNLFGGQKDGNVATADSGKSDEEQEKVEDEKKVITNASCPEIYDDTDFYHQQLRELIEFKANISMNPAEITKQLADLQKLRQKMKKKVDTRASKGRKIRYVVHNKLVNFMAPNDTSEWTDESKTELYRSLFST